MLGKLVRQHHNALIDAQCGVAQLALEIIALEQFGIEGADIEIDSGGTVANTEIGRDTGGRRRVDVLGRG